MRNESGLRRSRPADLSIPDVIVAMEVLRASYGAVKVFASVFGGFWPHPRHSCGGRNPEGTVPSFLRRQESRGHRTVIPAEAGIQRAPYRHSCGGRNPEGAVPSFLRRLESKRRRTVIPAEAGIQRAPYRHSCGGRNPEGAVPSFLRRQESRGHRTVIPAEAGIQRAPYRHSCGGRNPEGLGRVGGSVCKAFLDSRFRGNDGVGGNDESRPE